MIGNWVGERLGDLLQAAVQAAVGFILWILDLIWTMIQGLTNPDLAADFVRAWAGRIFYISLPLLFIFFIAQVLLAVSKGSLQQMGKAVLGVMIGIVGTSFSVPLVAYLTHGADTLADGLVSVAMADVTDGFAQPLFGDASGAEIYATFAGSIANAGTNPFATAAVVGAFTGIFWLIVVLGALALFIALLIRTNLLYVMVVIGPIMLAGLPWKATHTWARRWVSLVIALVFTKLGVVVVMAVGTGMLTSPITTEISGTDEATTAALGLMGNFIGAGIMLIVAALTPVATFKFFDFLGENAVATLHAGARGPIDTGKQMVTSRLHPGMLAGHTRTPAPIPTGNGGGNGSLSGASAGAAGEAKNASNPPPPPPSTPGADTGQDAQDSRSPVPATTSNGATSPAPAIVPGPRAGESPGGVGDVAGDSPDAGSSVPMWDQTPTGGHAVGSEPVIAIPVNDHAGRASGPLPVHSADQPPPTPPAPPSTPWRASEE